MSSTWDNAQRTYDNLLAPEPVSDWEQQAAIEEAGNKAAEAIFHRVALVSNGINDPRDRLASEVGQLRAHVRDLCIQLAEKEAGL